MIRIIHVLSVDPKVREAVVANATAFVQKQNAAGPEMHKIPHPILNRRSRN